MEQIDERDRAILRDQAQEALRPGLDSRPPSLFIFVGAGVSIATTQGTRSPAVGWKELLRRGCQFARTRLLGRQQAALGDIEDILDDERATATDLTRAAEDLERLLGLVSFRDFLEAEFGPQQRLDAAVLQAHPLYRQLMRLREAGARLVTVNYDTLIEHANGLYPIDWTSPDVNNFFLSPDPVPDKLVLHLHGRWNHPRSVVFGTTTYDVIAGEGTAARDVQTIRARLQALFAEKHVLFVGCGDTTSDPHFVKIFQEYERIIDIPTRRHVHLCIDSEFSRFRRNMPDHVVTMPYGTHGDLANAFHLLFPDICPSFEQTLPPATGTATETEVNAPPTVPPPQQRGEEMGTPEQYPSPGMRFPGKTTTISTNLRESSSLEVCNALTPDQYRRTFDNLVARGYRLTCVSGYTLDNELRFVAIFEKNSSSLWVARHGMTSPDYEKAFNLYVGQGYRLVLVNGYQVNRIDHYVAIWEKSSSGPWVARHGMNSLDYQNAFDIYLDQGYRLKHVSGYAFGNDARYAAIWEKTDDGIVWSAGHNMTSADYETTFNSYVVQGYRLVLVNGYQVNDIDRYVAIWHKASSGPWVTRHRMTLSDYQSACDTYLDQGYRLKHVSGYAFGKDARYAAIWEKTDDSIVDICARPEQAHPPCHSDSNRD